mmetsp:Transcript_6218/g.16251  ORF Transcript_6218/g.16251 Transcript_6218/m.16251 type:complete len:99 (-) Transcript_6218:455-751(-)
MQTVHDTQGFREASVVHQQRRQTLGGVNGVWVLGAQDSRRCRLLLSQQSLGFASDGCATLASQELDEVVDGNERMRMLRPMNLAAELQMLPHEWRGLV